ncbi:FAD-dependent oxidoreductase [Gordonia sp. SL306]|uniref:FAD-dependent oxidoreductase n=1 Tax=Gordonia sp. SL306 TaxID=2995145 RepID=UPI0022711553|nr:FAD-dependent oxidoreductase [Gordonia sp. SL306]WAC55496.1 FAD-dependent oxidoreductase [Gordonia sp. SL306]
MTVRNRAERSPSGVETADLCIVGAGIAGMNALFAATRYLGRGHKVILVDRRIRPGGMWVDTYPYVRLHQPHGLFTAGNVAWTLDRDRSYLANRNEVLDHFDHLVSVLGERVRVDEHYGWTLESTTESGGTIRSTFRAGDGDHMVVETPRLIKAYGLAVQPNDPLALSSPHVRSVSPNSWDVNGEEMRASDAPVWIIGSGKTAMDTAHAIISRYPGREVNMVSGAGTFFLSRDRFYPSGTRRWWGGARPNGTAAAAALRFDGTNEKEVTDWFRTAYGTGPIPDATHNLYGILSEAESTTIVNGLNTVIHDHLVDAVARGGATQLRLRSGSSTPVDAGSWIVNCTGYVARGGHPYEPYMSDTGGVVTVDDRSAVLHLPTYMGYFLTHLMFLDKLHEIPLYELDVQELREKGAATVPYTLAALAQYNLSLIADSVPRKVLAEAGFSLDLWYPLPRQMVGLVEFALSHRRQREHHRRTLDIVRDRFDIRCGPLVRGPRRSE